MRQENNELGLKGVPESISQLHFGLTAIRDAVEEKADAKQVEELHDDDIAIERNLLGLQTATESWRRGLRSWSVTSMGSCKTNLNTRSKS